MSALCLVPTRLRAERAARRLCDAQGGVLLETRVSTVDGLVPGLLAAAGVRLPVLPPLAERLLALEAGEAQGGLFAALAPESGLARGLAAALSELRRAEVAPGTVRAAARELGGGPGERLAALSGALEAYEARLAEGGVLDRPAAIREAARALGPRVASEEFRDLDLLVLEGFAALPPASLDLVLALVARARRTQVRVPYFPERPDLSVPAEALVRRLEALHALPAEHELEIVFEEVQTGREPRLARILGALSSGRAVEGGAERGRLSVLVGAGEDGCFDRAAEEVARLGEEGFALHEIIILASTPSEAAQGLARACAARGIPFASGLGMPLVEAPPVRAVLAARAAALEPGRATLEAVAESPYLGLGRGPGRLRYWLDRAGALEGRGEPEEALRRRAALLRGEGRGGEREALLRSAESLGELRGALQPLAAPGLPREHAARLRAFIASAGLRRRAARGELEVARRDLAALLRLEEVADELVRALALLGRGGEYLPAERFAALLGSALAEASFHPAAEPVAGAVELWPISEAPGLSARASILLGCERGRLPSLPPPDVFLRDAERAALARAAGRVQVATPALRRAEALHVAFCAFAAAREALVLVVRGAGPEGPGPALAPLAEEALRAAGVERPAGVSAEPALGESRSPAEALRALARAARRRPGPALEGLAPRPALLARAASVLARGELEQERRAAVLARRAVPAAGALPRELLGELARALPDEWSPSQLDEHARCPYRLFAGTVLSLGEPELAALDPDPRDEGRIAHLVLERFLKGRVARGAWPLCGAPEEKGELGAVAAEVFATFEAEGRCGDPAVWAARRQALLARLERVIAAEAGADPSLRPALLEYRFGEGSGVPALAFADPEGGGEVRLRGRIDRVDASADRLLVIDYKSGRRRDRLGEKLESGALGTTSFQLPIYLLAAARALPGRARLEATYELLGTGERLEPLAARRDDPLFAADPEARAAARKAGVVPLAEAVISAVRQVEKGEMPIASRDCGGCAYGAVCRFEAQAEERS